VEGRAVGEMTQLLILALVVGRAAPTRLFGQQTSQAIPTECPAKPIYTHRNTRKTHPVIPPIHKCKLSSDNPNDRFRLRAWKNLLYTRNPNAAVSAGALIAEGYSMKRAGRHLMAAFLAMAFVVLSPTCVASAQDSMTRVTRSRFDLDPTWTLNKRWSFDIEL